MGGVLVLVCISYIPTLTTTSISTLPGQCSNPLGMENGRISSSQISASSTYQHSLVGAGKGRLNSEAGGGAWCPKSMISSLDENQEYLQIDLLVDHIITAVVIQGRFANGLGQEFTEYFLLQFWREGMEEFVDYGKDGEALVLTANKNTYQAVEQVINQTLVIASKVRIVPYSIYPRTVCLRVEVKGCRYVALRSTEKGDIKKDTIEDNDNEDDWTEAVFLGVAVGILVTVVVAAVAAIVLVLVRNTKQKRNLSELAHYNNLNTSTINSSIQSSLTSKHCIAGVVVNQYKDENILNYVIFNRNNHLEQDRVADPNQAKPSLRTMTKSYRSSSTPLCSSPSTNYVQCKRKTWRPLASDDTNQSFHDVDIYRSKPTVTNTG